MPVYNPTNVWYDLNVINDDAMFLKLFTNQVKKISLVSVKSSHDVDGVIEISTIKFSMLVFEPSNVS